MKDDGTDAARPPIVIERSYEAAVEDLWELWTTKDGFESWWGPEGFRVEVHAIEPRVGGKLSYDMIAVGAEQVAWMKGAGMPLSHPTTSKFVEVVPLRRLKILSVIDFLPGVEPYDNHILVEFEPKGSSVRMVVSIEPHRDEKFTGMAVAGFESQLTKLPGVLAARRAARSGSPQPRT
jgi:uncharacterized protein YndB with AHSA1/START domain